MHERPAKRIVAAHGSRLMAVVLWLAGLSMMSLAGCGQRNGPGTAEKPRPVTQTTVAPTKYAYNEWSAWQLDCKKRAADINAPCAAVRKRICQIEGTQEGVACEFCGGQCREVVDDEKSLPRHFYTAWSTWQSGCNACDAVPKACKAERTRVCVDRLSGNGTDCEFCGGACSEKEDRMSTCSPECKSTLVVAYSDEACSVPSKDDIFGGPWGPQTNSPFNAGCSETQPSEKCVKFGRNYYKWGRCVPGCAPPPQK